MLDPRLASASCLAAALAQQYFGLLLLPKGPEDTWLLKGLAGWLEGQGLKQIVGSNELHYRQWQVGRKLCGCVNGSSCSYGVMLLLLLVTAHGVLLSKSAATPPWVF